MFNDNNNNKRASQYTMSERESGVDISAAADEKESGSGAVVGLHF